MRPRVRRRLARSAAARERGAVLVLASLLMTALLGFTALVVDIANTTQVRRQAQSSADAAALAGAYDLPDLDAVVASVKEYAYQNLEVAYSDWPGCSDPDALAVLPEDDHSCISVDDERTAVQVRLPVRQVDTFFGGALGVASFDVTASARAEAQLRQDGRIIPAAVTSSMGTGNLCIENSGNNSDCADRSSGNFGSLESPRLNIYFPASNEDPSNLKSNYALSLDHDVQTYVDGGARICDGTLNSPCSVSNYDTAHSANHMNVYTGNAVPPVTEGFVTGFEISTTDEGDVAFCGRLARPDITEQNVADPMPDGECNPGSPPLDVLSGNKQTTINGRHAYHWLEPEMREVFYPELDGDTLAPTTDSRYNAGDERLHCFLEGYRYVDGVEQVAECDEVALPDGRNHWWPIFQERLIDDPRFGVIPVLSHWPSGSSEAVEVEGFWAQYIYRVYTSDTKVQALDAWVFDPALISTGDPEATEPGQEFGHTSNPVVRLIG